MRVGKLSLVDWAANTWAGGLKFSRKNIPPAKVTQARHSMKGIRFSCLFLDKGLIAPNDGVNVEHAVGTPQNHPNYTSFGLIPSNVEWVS